MTWVSPSRSIPHTVDYITTLCAIAYLFEILGGEHSPYIDLIPGLIQETIQNVQQPCQEIGQALSNFDQFFVLGAGPNWGTAQYGAAKFWEACGILGLAFEMEEIAHGPHKLINQQTPIFLIAPEGKSKLKASLLIEGLNALDAPTFVISNCSDFPETNWFLNIPSIPEEWSPFIACIPLQMLTLSIASAKGYDVELGEGRVKDIKKIRGIQRKWIRKSLDSFSSLPDLDVDSIH